jgi:hypothetical protein
MVLHRMRLLLNTDACSVTPVMFPPGWARLATILPRTG